MIQRIQTVYLLVVVILSLLTFFMPVMAFAGIDGIYELSYKGYYNISTGQVLDHAWGLTALGMIIPLIAAVTISLYKKRSLQVRLSIYNIILMVGYYGLYFFLRHFYVQKTGFPCTMLWPMILPAVSVILTLLAIRAILSDDARIRAADRLR